MVKSEAIQTEVMQSDIQVTTVAVMELRGPMCRDASGTCMANVREAHTQA